MQSEMKPFISYYAGGIVALRVIISIGRLQTELLEARIYKIFVRN